MLSLRNGLSPFGWLAEGIRGAPYAILTRVPSSSRIIRYLRRHIRPQAACFVSQAGNAGTAYIAGLEAGVRARHKSATLQRWSAGLRPAYLAAPLQGRLRAALQQITRRRLMALRLVWDARCLRAAGRGGLLDVRKMKLGDGCGRLVSFHCRPQAAARRRSAEPRKCRLRPFRRPSRARLRRGGAGLRKSPGNSRRTQAPAESLPSSRLPEPASEFRSGTARCS